MAEGDIVWTVVISTLVILLLVAGVTILLLINNRQLSKQQTELAQTRLSYEQELRRTENEIGEQLMGQFARELHDNIGHLLTCMRLEVENKKLDHPGFQKLIEPLEGYLDDASGQLRLLSRSFNSDYVSNVGLATAISLEVQRQQQLRKFSIEWELKEGATSLDKNQELIVFRIIQEAFQNAIRHSKATVVKIRLSMDPFHLHLSDNGKGFEISTVLSGSNASGLRNILRRCELAHLACELKSAPGEGCTYTLFKQAPLHEQ